MPRFEEDGKRTKNASTAAEMYVEDPKAFIPAVHRRLGNA